MSDLRFVCAAVRPIHASQLAKAMLSYPIVGSIPDKKGIIALSGSPDTVILYRREWNASDPCFCFGWLSGTKLNPVFPEWLMSEDLTDGPYYRELNLENVHFFDSLMMKCILKSLGIQEVDPVDRKEALELLKPYVPKEWGKYVNTALDEVLSLEVRYPVQFYSERDWLPMRKTFILKRALDHMLQSWVLDTAKRLSKKND